MTTFLKCRYRSGRLILRSYRVLICYEVCAIRFGKELVLEKLQIPRQGNCYNDDEGEERKALLSQRIGSALFPKECIRAHVHCVKHTFLA